MANCSANKARMILNYHPKISLEQTLQDMIDWVKLRGPMDFDHSLPIEIMSDLTPITWRDQERFDS
jgi:hypothetical protein